MTNLSLNLVDILGQIRGHALAIAGAGWPEAGQLLDAILPDPLDPIALLPVATGTAVGADVTSLVHVAAVITLADVSLRIVDDCADRDDPYALYQAIGVGRALNLALALQTIVARELAHLPAAGSQAALFNAYTRSLLQVCHGQDREMRRDAYTLAEYREIVELKTVAAYEFATAVSAHIASSDPSLMALCVECGRHLGWMTQILDDVESLWFPIMADANNCLPMTFPVLVGLTMDHPQALSLADHLQAGEHNRAWVCMLLDEMGLRPYLLTLALDHRDAAIKTLAHAPHQAGGEMLQLWLDWYLRDAHHLLEAPYGVNNGKPSI